MASAQPGFKVIRKRSRQRVCDGVKEQGDEKRGARQRAGQAQHLIVVEQNKQREGGVLQTLCKLPNAKGELAGQWNDAVVGCRGCCHGAIRPEKHLREQVDYMYSLAGGVIWFVYATS